MHYQQPRTVGRPILCWVWISSAWDFSSLMEWDESFCNIISWCIFVQAYQGYLGQQTGITICKWPKAWDSVERVKRSLLRSCYAHMRVSSSLYTWPANSSTLPGSSSNEKLTCKLFETLISLSSYEGEHCVSLAEAVMSPCFYPSRHLL